jgi:transposase
VWFTYSPDRKGEHPQRHLAKFRGILQADAYSGFKKLYQDGSVREAPCMGHIRRKFYDLMETHHSAVATKAVEGVAAPYLIEKEIRGRPPEERNARARPLLESMREWLKASLLPTPPQVGDHRGYPLCARPGALSRRRLPTTRARQLLGPRRPPAAPISSG